MASKHIGSSLFITDASGIASQHLQYLPFGELFVEQQTLTNYSTPYKFSGKEKDEETSYSYFGARYYMSDVSVWLSVDPLADKYPNMSPYNYCHWNPVVLTDPDGMDDGWVEDPNDKSKGIYWDPKVNTQAEAQTAGVKYHGQEGYGTNEETGGRVHYKPDGTSEESATTLATHKVYGFRGDGAVCRAMEKSMNQGYDPNWINCFKNCKIIPDYVGISISGTVIPGGGFGGAATLGYVRGDGIFGNLSADEGFGFDVSYSVSITTAYYRGVGKPTAKSLSGVSAYQNYGSVLNFTSWQDISSNNGKLRLGDYWVGGTVKASLGSKTIFGGSAGTTLTTKPLMLW